MKNASATPASSGSQPAPLTPTRILRDNVTRLRVRYCECDPMGVAHHSSYIPWLEIGRTELLRSCGVAYADLERAGVFLVVVKLDIRYRRPIRYDDLVEVRTHWHGGSKVKIEHTYEIVVVERNGQPVQELAAPATTTLGCVDAQGKVTLLPDWLMTENA